MLCITVSKIRFQDLDGQWVVIAQDSEIYVDAAEGVAFYNGLHFYIDRDEYTTMS